MSTAQQHYRQKSDCRTAVRHAGCGVLSRPTFNARRQLNAVPRSQIIEAGLIGLNAIEQDRIKCARRCAAPCVHVVKCPRVGEVQRSAFAAEVEPKHGVNLDRTGNASAVDAVASRAAEHRSLRPLASAVHLRIPRSRRIGSVASCVDVREPSVQVAPRLIECDVAQYRSVEAGSRSRGAQPGEQTRKQGRFHVGDETRQGSANSLDYANQ